MAKKKTKAAAAAPAKKKLQIEPLGDRVLVYMDSAPDRIGSIVIPEGAKEKPLKGTVVAAGEGQSLPDGTFRPCTVKTGDRVIISKYAGTELDIEELADGNCRIVRNEDILARIHD